MANTLRKMPRTIWRVERENNGAGPYVDNGDCPVGTHLLNKHGLCPQHPAPPAYVFRYNSAGGRRRPADESRVVCGFVSLADLLEWFDQEDRWLMKKPDVREYVVCKYSVPAVLWLDEFGQCVFNLKDSEKLETLSIGEAEKRGLYYL